MRYLHMIELQYLPKGSSEWASVARMHAGVNKTSGDEYLAGGAIQSQEFLTFTVRYCAAVAGIRRNTQRYRVLYKGSVYKIQDYDDFQEQHKSVKLKGVSYHG